MKIKKISYFHRVICFIFTFLCIISISGCSKSEAPVEKTEKGSRDHTPCVLTPECPGTQVYSNENVTIDASNTSEGYLMVQYSGSNPKVKMQIQTPDDLTYTYDLDSNYQTFPLPCGDGTYTVSIYENISDTKYAMVCSESIDVTISNTFGPFLYPSQYVNFNADSQVVAKASELASTADTDLEVVQNVYNYIINNVAYDYEKAGSVQTGYLPNVDETLASNKGICFDYASMMAAMLRSQRIPTRLDIGYAGEIYHAWISVYTKEEGWIDNVIEFYNDQWILMDPTFASTTDTPEGFAPDEDTYNIKFIY